MIALIGFEQVNLAWVVLKKEGCVLFGFLLYTSSDRAVVDYMKDGTVELDVLSGTACAVFLIDSPSEEWINYSQRSNHPWWRLFGRELAEKLKQEPPKQKDSIFRRFSIFQKITITENSATPIIIGDGNISGDHNIVTLGHILAPKISLLYNRVEALKVASHFGIKGSELPCLIFFKELDDHVIWRKQLEHLKSQEDLKLFFRHFFESKHFASLVSQVVP